MTAARQYNFDNVLVADTELLSYVNQSSNAVQQPQILVFNNKLIKCQRSLQNVTQNCSSCCLQVESSEFRRRSTASAFVNTSSQCFAKCSERRKVDIELRAKAQLSGKLVILALTRIERLSLAIDELSHFRETQETNLNKIGVYKCTQQNSWLFSRFEPTSDELMIQSRQTFYSRFSSNQVPIMSINTISVYWDPSKRKEIVSIGVHSNRFRKYQQVVVQETLLISELNCQYSRSNVTISNGSEDSSEANSVIHLMMLINRDFKTARNKLENNEGAVEIRKERINIDPEGQHNEIGPESYIHLPDISESLSSIIRVGEKPSVPKQPAINNRIDSQSMPNNLHQLESTGRTNGSSSSRFGQSNLATEIDSVRLRLRSNSLVMLTVSSSFVILIYTLCLLIYLKSRNRTKSSVKVEEFQRQKENSSSNGREKRQQLINISEPFNLEMPPETRTRLEIMLNSKSNVELSPSAQSMDINYHEHEPEQISDYQSRPTMIAFSNHRYHHHHYPIGYGTINVVRAIRRAATMARSRLGHPTRYRPNLNVIPESDFEYLQQQQYQHQRHQKTRYEANDDDVVENFLRSSSLTGPYQVESLVQDAMTTECSHIAQKFFYQQPQAQTQTLFSVPMDEKTGVVSRRRILRTMNQVSSTKRKNVHSSGVIQ